MKSSSRALLLLASLLFPAIASAGGYASISGAPVSHATASFAFIAVGVLSAIGVFHFFKKSDTPSFVSMGLCFVLSAVSFVGALVVSVA